MSDFKPMQWPMPKQPVGYEILANGCLCFIMPAEADPDAEQWVFVLKVRITDNLRIPDGNGYLLPVMGLGEGK